MEPPYELFFWYAFISSLLDYGMIHRLFQTNIELNSLFGMAIIYIFYLT